MADGCTKLVTSSGGNAGLAVAFAARKLGVQAIVVVPEISNPMILQKIRNEGADVRVAGCVWDEANEHALQLIASLGSEACYIHPFDDQLVWDGHASIIEEIAALQEQPAALIVSCGGGGLLVGLLQGLKKRGWQDTEVIVIETHGAHSFRLMTEAGGQRAKLDKLTSRAVTLGALEVAPILIDYYHGSAFKITSLLVTDEEAVNAGFKFVEDHRMLVELSCSASLAAIYNGSVSRLLKEKNVASGNVVTIVCGGAAVTTDIMHAWRQSL